MGLKFRELRCVKYFVAFFGGYGVFGLLSNVHAEGVLWWHGVLW
jgi:hypothetical protein